MSAVRHVSAVVPSLDDIARDPHVAATLPRSVIADLYAVAARVEAGLRAHLLAAVPDPERTSASEPDRVLGIDDAAATLGMTRDYLYRHWSTLQVAYKDVDGHVKFPLSKIQRYIRMRAGR